MPWGQASIPSPSRQMQLPRRLEWDPFYDSTVDGSTTVHYRTVEYGGAGGENSNIYCNSASPTIQHCIIRNSDGNGIYTTGSGSAPLISCSALTNNDYGVYATGNTSSGVSNTTSSITIDAENNWWGSCDGPSGSGPGSGDAVSNYVAFTQWRTAFDSCLETIVLSPPSDTNYVGSQHTVTAEVLDEDDNNVVGVVVSFEITAGLHAGQNGTDTTDAG